MKLFPKQTAVAQKAVAELKILYPLAACSLTTINAFQLLVATRLSAQCTDARVNLVTPALFARFPTPESLAAADQTELQTLIYSTGFYVIKSRDLIAMAAMLCTVYGGIVPDTIEELIKLPGVGRKTANLIVGDIYSKPAVVADTHCIRIANRLGLCDTKDPYKVELALRALLPPEESNDFCHRLVLFGRDLCPARSPACGRCPLSAFCPSADTQNNPLKKRSIPRL